MKRKTCLRCGSNNLVADRALAGRIVCGVCGSLEIGNRIFNDRRFSVSYKRNKIIMFMLLATLIIIIIF